MTEELSREEVHAEVDRAVEELLAAAGVQGPPVDALTLARGHLGLAVGLEPDAPRGKARRGRNIPRPAPTEEETQWAAARAVGEHLKPGLLCRLGFEPDGPRPLLGTSLANLVAGHLLAPACWFGDDARAAGYDLLALKERYRTASHETLAWRLLDLSTPCIITVVEDGRVSRRRSNAWRVRKELAAPERLCQRHVHAQGRAHVVSADGWTVQGWPVPGHGGPREILRSVVDPDAVP